MSLNAQLSDLFATFAALMEIRGESPFKAIAFSKVSRLIKESTLDIRGAVEAGTLKEIEGIGESSRRIIEQFVRTGRSDDFDEVAASVPAGLIPMLQIPGLGPKTISLLWKERQITSIEELQAALDQGKLAGLKGIGEKKIATMRQGLALRTSAQQRVGIVDALAIGQDLLAHLRAIPQVLHAELAGSLRRRRETIGDIDILCALRDKSAGEAVSAAFAALPQVQRVLAQGVTKASVVTHAGVQVDLRIVPEENFGAALQYFTGSKEHNTRLRGLAQDKGMTLNEWGLYRVAEYDRAEKKTGEAPNVKAVASKTEADVYRALGLEFIEPVLREDRGEIDAAARNALPKLITLQDIRGDLHSHTTASDGHASIEEMAEAAKARGYEYLAITDHSKSQVIANGLSVERLLAHRDNIRRIGLTLKGITLLVGCEVDILADGRLDFEDEILKELDFVVASPHISLKQEAEKATQRIIRAIENPYVNVIGHPTGRLIFGREGLPLNFAEIFKAAAATGTALEINAAYPRLDLNDAAAYGAIRSGVKLSIDTDAHSVEGLDEMAIGISVAQRAWAEKKDVINCLPLDALRALVRAKRP